MHQFGVNNHLPALFCFEMRNLNLGCIHIAEMERDLLVERTAAGLERAKAQGKILGRPSKTTKEQRQEIATRLESGVTVSSLAREYAVSRASIISIRNTTVPAAI